LLAVLALDAVYLRAPTAACLASYALRQSAGALRSLVFKSLGCIDEEAHTERSTRPVRKAERKRGRPTGWNARDSSWNTSRTSSGTAIGMERTAADSAQPPLGQSAGSESGRTPARRP